MSSETLPRSTKPKKYVRAVGPRMRVLLWILFGSAAVLGASGLYLTTIRVFELVNDQVYQTQFSLWMFLFHLVLGLAIVVPLLFFGIVHYITSRNRTNKRAIWWGLVLFFLTIVVAVSGVALIQLDGMPQFPTGSLSRWVVYFLHIVTPVLAVVVYVIHRKAGPKIRWNLGYAWGIATAAFIIAMTWMHSHDPRQWHAKGSSEGEKYFEPSKARTVDGNFIATKALMNDEYCLKCHPDIYQTHLHSAHRFSSFNNPAYLFSVIETRERMGVRASRWCAGCHDPVPFFTGAFDDPNFDMKKHPTSQAGISCTTCHAMTHVNSRSGNADFTIEEPIQYPFTYSDNPLLQWVNNQLIKAKPDFHKKTFLKSFHRSREMFCSVCHKVGIPMEVNHYKEFLRGQNHSDSYFLSGVSGHGVRSFYYPPKSKTCNDCHMPLLPSNDFGAQDFDNSGIRKIHDHTFLGANTGVPELVKYKNYQNVINKHRDFLRGGIDGKSPTMRIDIFGLKELAISPLPILTMIVGESITATPVLGQLPLLAFLEEKGVEAPLIDDQPIRPNLPVLQKGHTYLVETVIRTLNMGHHFTQGTVDSNEVWVEFIAKSGNRIIGRSGQMTGDDEGEVDEWSHFINVLMLDRYGNRVDRRNAQDIFTPLYNNQIPPGAGQVAHYRLQIPQDITENVELFARVRYRKFDYTYMAKVHAGGVVPKLPIVDLCEDSVILPVKGVKQSVAEQVSPIKAYWQRWNDYGIACFLEGGPEGKMGGELSQAERSFARLLSPEFANAKEAHAHGYLNLARVHYAYGGTERLDQARDALTKAMQCDPPAPWWTVAWFNGLINMQNVNFDAAIKQFQTILDPRQQPTHRNFDFTKDFVVRNQLGQAYFMRAQQEEGVDDERRDHFLRLAAEQFEKTLELDAEDVTAHEFLGKVFARLGADPVSINSSVQDNEPLAKELSLLLAKATNSAKKYEICNTLLANTKNYDVSTLIALRRQWRDLSASTDDQWLLLSMTPVLHEIDAVLLEKLQTLSKEIFSEKGSGPIEAKALLLADGLAALSESVSSFAGVRVLLPATMLPNPGHPIGLMLTGLAEKNQLQGGLPKPRRLALEAIHKNIRPRLQEASLQEFDAPIALALSRIHRLLHMIYKPDDNAAGQAIRIYRQNHPAADHASHSIVIYDLNRHK